jgi:hypothetical protein
MFTIGKTRVSDVLDVFFVNYCDEFVPFVLGCWLLFSVSNIFLPIYSNFSIPAVILSIPVITAVILFTVTCF